MKTLLLISLIAFTVSGTFNNGRSIDKVHTYSKYVILDIDKLETSHLQLIKNTTRLAPYTYASFVSPSGKGLKIIVKVNTTTGEIQHIVNHTDIIDKWKTYKLQLESSYSTIENKEAVEALKEFISMVNKQITIETHLIDDLKTKMFFDVYFNKHLVNSSEKLQPYQRTFSSQLFKSINVDLQIRQDLLNDNEEEIQVRKVSEMPKGIEKLPKIIESYDKIYKPMIEYKFSEYKASFRERVIYNKQAYFLKESEITILEEVKNNIQLLVHYTLKKID